MLFNVVRTVTAKKAKETKTYEILLTEKLKRAEEAHELHVRAVRKKAENENSKVDEISFIKAIANEEATLVSEAAKMSLQKKLNDSEARRLELQKNKVSVTLVLMIYTCIFRYQCCNYM